MGWLMHRMARHPNELLKFAEYVDLSLVLLTAVSASSSACIRRKLEMKPRWRNWSIEKWCSEWEWGRFQRKLFPVNTSHSFVFPQSFFFFLIYCSSHSQKAFQLNCFSICVRAWLRRGFLWNTKAHPASSGFLYVANSIVLIMRVKCCLMRLSSIICGSIRCIMCESVTVNKYGTESKIIFLFLSLYSRAICN